MIYDVCFTMIDQTLDQSSYYSCHVFKEAACHVNKLRRIFLINIRRYRSYNLYGLALDHHSH